MAIIPSSEVVFNPSSYVDPNARVFAWNNELYRAFSQEKETFYRDLIASPLLKYLQRSGKIIKTDLTDHSLDGFSFVVKHDRIPCLSYCNEWPAVMLKEAALLTLELCSEFAEKNLSLQDAYPWNIYFNAAKPIFIDISSIVPAPKTLIWTPYQQFCQFFLYPLHLYRAGHSNIVRKLLIDYLNGISEDEYLRLLPLKYKLTHPAIFSRSILPALLQKRFPVLTNRLTDLPTNQLFPNLPLAPARKAFFSTLTKEIQNIKLPDAKSAWSNYASHEPKKELVAKIIGQIMPKTVLDLACNRGDFSVLAAKQGCAVVALDRDENCVAALYQTAQKERLNIQPLVIDILNPTPSFGWNSKQFPSAIARLQCDLVLALAVVHHLVFKQYQNFDRVAKALKAFSKRWVLVEFPRPDDQMVKTMRQERCAWYNLDNFIKALENYFAIKEVIDSYPATRKLVLGERKDLI